MALLNPEERENILSVPMSSTMCSIGLILSASSDRNPLGFLTPALGTLAYYLLIANRGRSDEQILEGNGASAKQIKLKSWHRPSTILTLMLGGFSFV
jgi:hypothetical protein